MKSNPLPNTATRCHQPTATPKAGGSAKPWLVPGVVLVVATVVCYFPALGAGFIWDDDTMLTNNPFVRLPLGLYYIWCSTALPDYFPLTSTSFWLEWRLRGMNATGYHLTNVLLHGARCHAAGRTGGCSAGAILTTSIWALNGPKSRLLEVWSLVALSFSAAPRCKES